MSGILRSRIPLIIGELRPKVLEAVEESAERIVEGAQRRVPVDSGSLREAIHVEAEGGQVAVVAGDDDVFYGHIVENGSVHTPPRPFLVPAFEEERSALEDAIGEKLRDL